MGPLFQADFVMRCKWVRERMEDKEQEVHGKWYTEDALKKSGKYSASSIKAMVAYCKRFPESLVRPGKYILIL